MSSVSKQPPSLPSDVDVESRPEFDDYFEDALADIPPQSASEVESTDEQEIEVDAPSVVEEIDLPPDPEDDEEMMIEVVDSERADSTQEFPRAEKDPDSTRLATDADSVLTSLHAFVERELDQRTPDDGRRRAVLQHEMGHLEEIVHREETTALRRYEQGFADDPSFLPVHRALRRHLWGDGRWQSYVEALKAEIEATRGEQQRALLLTLLGEVQWRRLGAAEQAIESLLSAIALVPRSRRALEILRAVYANQKRWEDLLGALRGMANITTDAVERARLIVEMAELCERRLDRRLDAEQLYAQAVDLDPDNESALVALRRLYLLHQRWQRLSELLAREAGQEHGPIDMFADLYRAAHLAEVHLHDDARAASLLETAAALRPTDNLPLQALALIYERTGRSEDLAATIARLAQLSSDPQVRADLLFRLAQIYQDRLARPEKGLETYRMVLKEQPGHEAALRGLAGLYARLECWADLLDLELLRAERHRDTNARAESYVRAARICERHLGDTPRAIELYDRAWRVQPALLEAFRALERIYRQEQRWASLAEVCEHRAGLTSDAVLAVAMLRKAARVCEERLDDPQRAISLLERLCERQPDDREALIDLTRLYEQSGHFELMVRFLERWAALTEDPGERAELERRVAELLHSTLGQSDKAIDRCQAILRDQPADGTVRDQLKIIYEQAGRWNDLVRTLQGELEHVSDDGEAAALLLQIGHLQRDKLGVGGEAQKSYTAALSRDPQCAPAALALERLLRSEGAWGALAELWTSQAERMRDTDASASLLCRAAELHEERLSQPSRAVELLGRALELDAACLPAHHGLERIYLASEDHDALESHYTREAEAATNPLLRVRSYLRLASLLDRGSGGDEAAAVAAYESALQVVRDQPDALHGLAAMYRRQGAWPQLAELLGRMAAATEDRDAALSALKEWASILETIQDEQWDPTPIYERILDADPQDQHAIAALERLAYQKADLESIVRLSMLQVRGATDEALVAGLCMRAASVLVTMARYQEAAELLRRALDAAPSYLPAVRLARSLHEQMGNWRDVAEMLRKEGELVGSAEGRNSALVRAGTIMMDRLADMTAARGLFETVLATDPEDERASERLTTILAGVGEWVGLAEHYRRRLDRLDGQFRAPLQLELVEIYRDRLGEPAAAIQLLGDLLATQPDHVMALEQVAALCADQGRWREAEEYLGRLAEVVADEPERYREAVLNRADVLVERLGEEESALAVLNELLVRQSGDRDALEQCAAIYRRWGDWDKTVEVLRDLAHSGDPAARVSALVDLAEVGSRSTAEPDTARTALEQAAMVCAQTGESIDPISAYFERRGDFEGLIELYGQALADPRTQGTAGMVKLRLARSRILAGRLLRPDDAEREVREALQGDPNSLPARLELAGLRLWADRLDDAAADYLRALDLDPFCHDAHRGLFRVYERRGDTDRAATACQALVALGGAVEAESELAAQAVEATATGLAAAASNPLGLEGYWDLLAYDDDTRPARELLLAVGDYLPQIGLIDPDAAGGPPTVPLSEDDPIYFSCRGVAAALGVTRFRCALAREMELTAEVRPTRQLTVVLDAEFAATATAAQLRFAAGRALAEILSRSAYINVMPSRSLELLLAAVVELFERGFGDHLGRPDELADLSRRLGRAVPRKVRKGWEELARAYAAQGPMAPARARRSARRAAERAGLLASGDVAAALGVLAREETRKSIVSEVLRFSAEPTLYEGRRRLGLCL